MLYEVITSSTVSADNLSYILDGDESTKWNSGTAQTSNSNQYITIDCQQKIVFDKLSLLAGETASESPAYYNILTSTDA